MIECKRSAGGRRVALIANETGTKRRRGVLLCVTVCARRRNVNDSRFRH